MALRNRDGWLSGDLGLTGPLRVHDAAIWEESSWLDLSNRWASLWDGASPQALTQLHGARSLDDGAQGGCGCLTCTMSLKYDQALKAVGDDPYTGGGPAGAPQPPSGEAPQFVGDAIGDNTSSTTTITVGGSLNSLIDHGGDRDYIKVSLVAGQTYTFSLDGQSMDDGYLELRSSLDVMLDEDDDGGIIRDAFMMYMAQTTGDHWIVARGFDNGFGSQGTYSLTVNTIQTGNSSPTNFPDNGKAEFSWEEAAIQITRSGSGWMNAFGSSVVITYAYRASAPAQMPDDTGGFSQFNAAQITATEASLAAWAAVANITFVRVDDGGGYSNNATMLFGNYSTGADGAAAFAYLPSTGATAASSVQGDVWVNVSIGYNATPVRGDYGYQVLLHEIGHALGLSHPGDYNAGEGEGPIEYPTHAEYFNDSRMFVTMSYFGSSNTGGNLPAFASLPQLHDIAAIQRLYGANLATRTGDTIYGFNSNTGVPEYSLTVANQGAVFAVWDGGGTDTLDLSGYTTGGTVDLREEAFSSVGGSVFNMSIARGAIIENAIGGSGNDTIIGNAANNTLNGGAGADAMSGGLGDDTYIVDSASDAVNENSGEGADTIQAALNWTLAANIENLTITGSATVATGNGGANAITGNGLANTLSGLDGNDTLLGAAGMDTLIGGLGDDNIQGGADADTITYALGDGADTIDGGSEVDVMNITDSAGAGMLNVTFGGGVLTGVAGGSLTSVESVNTDLGGGVNTLVYAATAAVTVNLGANAASGFASIANITNVTGGTGNDNLTGNAAVNQLNGGDGADTLNGAAGADVLIGGLGNDTYVVDNAGDAITENTGEGTDSVQASLDWTIGAQLENLTLTAGTNGTGNALANVISGNTGANTLNGLDGNDTLNGGDGADTLVGGLGVDTLNGGAGDDVFDWVFGDGNGVIDGGADSDTFNIAGNASSNILRANYNGAALIAAAGNTLASVEVVNAAMGGGGDLLEYVAASSAVSVNLATSAASGFASLSGIRDVTGGGGNDNLTGDGADNKLSGSDGDDALSGAGGVDQLFGGNGADTFYGGLGNDNVKGEAGDDQVFWVWGDGNDVVDGGADNDTVTFAGTAGSNLFKVGWDGAKLTGVMSNPLANVENVLANTGGGGDWLMYMQTVGGISVNLVAGTASGFASISGVSHVLGGAGNDALTGNDAFNKLEGGDGDDALVAGDGADQLKGGAGNDALSGGLGIDTIAGGDGDDAILWAWGDGPDAMDGGANTDSATFTGNGVANLFKVGWNGSVLTDVMSGSLASIEQVHADGGGGGDWLIYQGTAGATANLTTLTASGFASIANFANLQGGAGADVLTGDGAANKIIGGDGADTIAGGGANDTLTGGLGNDTFVYAPGAGTDSIADFDADAAGGQDLLDITGFGVTALDFGARVSIFDAGASTIVTIDGSVVITLAGVDGNGDNAITSADFLLS